MPELIPSVVGSEWVKTETDIRMFRKNLFRLRAKIIVYNQRISDYMEIGWKMCRCRALVIALMIPLLAGCSIRTIAINSLAGALTESASVYASDEDPELVRDALPFSLKTIESLLASSPDQSDLLLMACSGFTQYAYLFPHTDADLIELEDYTEAVVLRERAFKMYLRARDYCMRLMKLEYPRIIDQLVLDPEAVTGLMEVEDVDVLYWLGASWGMAISLGLDRPGLAADLPTVRALLDRALDLDETYLDGAIHEALIVLESVPEIMGGSPDRARDHFERAIELSNRSNSTPYVTLASSVSVAVQNRAEFERLLNEAIQIDPDGDTNFRLVNLITQERARYLLLHVDDLFIGPLE